MITIDGVQIFIQYPWEKDEDKYVAYASVQIKKLPHLNPMVMMAFYTIKIDAVRM